MIFDFTQCYPKRKEPGLEWHDCSAIGGSRLYCSRDAEEKIKALIAPVGVSGIHFIDSGDYHYISKIMTDFIKEPFTLVLIDHHTDMQDASLGGDILSCGNWAKKVLQENPYLQRLVLIGQEKKALDKLQSGARQQETDGKLVEIGNDVYMQYEKTKDGYIPLKGGHFPQPFLHILQNLHIGRHQERLLIFLYIHQQASDMCYS